MPVRYPDEFRQRAIELARTGDQPVTKVAADLGIATSCLRRWMKQDDIDGGRRPGVNTDEREELVRLRRELRTAQMEIEILRRAAVEAAVRQHGDTPIRVHQHRVAERRGTKIGRVAAARKLLILVYYGLRDGEIRCLAETG